MKKSIHPIMWFYEALVLRYPVGVVILIVIITGVFGFKIRDFRLDASAETLVLEGDRDLSYSRIIDERYNLESYLLLTFSPQGDLFSDQVLRRLKRLRNELKQLERVSSVITILDVPLFESPPLSVSEIVSKIRTLESDNIDTDLAKSEFGRSPLYRNLLVSPDFKTTALIINLKSDVSYSMLLKKRNDLRAKNREGVLSEVENNELIEVEEQFREYHDEVRTLRHEDIVSIRRIMNNYRDGADLFLGGVAMIADDLISFIKNDLSVFGAGVLCFLVLTLGVIFRKIRWIILPILCCCVSAIIMSGLLGIFGWEVTVVSSNFISLQLIITMAITLHLIVRFREFYYYDPEADVKSLVSSTVSIMMKPCFYTGLTTIAGFASLLSCSILPVQTFGWMMSGGIVVSLTVTFLLFPASLMIIGKGKPPRTLRPQFPLTQVLANVTEKHGRLILAGSFVVFLISLYGISRLEVENSFIDYFKSSTEIYQGMTVIDRELGGTTPLDVIVDFHKKEGLIPGDSSENISEDTGTVFDEFDEFDSDEDQEQYWFTAEKMKTIKRVHNYLESLPETGKVLSLATLIQVAETLNDNTILDSFELALLYKEIPEKYRTVLLSPYVSVEHDQVRFSVRVRDSEKTLKRDRLIKKIENDIGMMPGIISEQVHLTGMLVLYNNMLQALFSSQIMTLGIVLTAIVLMFFVLFRSLKVAVIAIVPNLLSIGAVLGMMGLLKIPLDIMTITIASISVGIAVDDTIHYIHRFREEYAVSGDYPAAMYRCHNSIGHAMYYTSLTIITGFSILVLSNFIPSIFFGLLTGLAMLIALIASLTLLPYLIIIIKPFGYASVS